MIPHACLSRRRLLAIAALGFLQGCHFRSQNQCGRDTGVRIPAPILPDAPALRIVGICAPPRQAEQLHFLTVALRDRLADLGGLRLLDVIQEDCEAGCRTDREQCPADTGEAHLTDFQLNETLPGTTPAPSAAAVAPFAEILEIRVRIDEFQAYRPMRLNAAFSVHEVTTGAEISLIQQTWYAPEPIEPPPRPLWSWHKYLGQTPAWSDIEAASLATLSPRTFLNSVAEEVAPAIHLTCLTRQGRIIE